jgi:hypothetical protein
MVWKGSRDDQGLYEARLMDNAWTPQQRITGRASSHSPAICTYQLNDGTPSTGLLMAWKGASGDQGLYYATSTGDGWSAQANIPGVGSSHRPALAQLGVPYMAWKGIDDDAGIYWSKLTATGWSPQQHIDGIGTSNSPALVAFRGRLFMFWKGVDDDEHAFFSSFDGTPGATWLPQRVIDYPKANASDTGLDVVQVRIGASRGLSATPHGDKVLVAWKGVEDDSGIYFSLFDGLAFSGQINVNAVGTSQGPGVGRIGAVTHMAWKGVEDDNVIYWSTLAGG